MRLTLILVTLIVAISGITSAQDYETAIGLRGGLASGVTLKHFVASDLAVEGILTTHFRGLQITGLAEIHQPAFDVPGLAWFYGGGGHVGFYSYYEGHPWFSESYTGSRGVIGVDGILGLEYTIQELPICLSIDLKPAFNLVGYSGFVNGGGISARYTFR